MSHKHHYESYGLTDADDLKEAQRDGVAEQQICDRNDWVLDKCLANIWPGDGSVKCPTCGENLNAGWHFGYHWASQWKEGKERQSGLAKWPDGISCFQCCTHIQRYENPRAVRNDANDGWVVLEEEE